MQLELHKSLVRFKRFTTEEEAKSYTNGKFELSNVGYDEQGYYRAYSKIGAWMGELAAEAGKYYNLRVTLKMDYAIAKDWLGCH